MNVQIIDRLPSGTDTEFAVGSGASLSSMAFARAVFVSSVVLDVAVLSASRLWVLESTASSEPTRTLDDIATKFRRLVDKWREDTEGYSSMAMMAAHDNYLAIIHMGWQAVPLILRDMRDGGGPWYKALRVITGTNPVTPEMAGNVGWMDDAWLNWGRFRKLV